MTPPFSVWTYEGEGQRKSRAHAPQLAVLHSAEVSIDNPAGGPFASRIFAVYVMPDDDAGDNDAQRLIETDIDRVRRRAIGFAELRVSPNGCRLEVYPGGVGQGECMVPEQVNVSPVEVAGRPPHRCREVGRNEHEPRVESEVDAMRAI